MFPDFSSIPTLTWVIIVLNSSILLLLYWKDPNEDIRRKIHRIHPNLYLVIKMCYTILFISLMLNMRFVFQKIVIDPGQKLVMKRLKEIKRSVRLPRL